MVAPSSVIQVGLGSLLGYRLGFLVAATVTATSQIHRPSQHNQPEHIHLPNREAMPTLILKKSFFENGFIHYNEASLSLHGSLVNSDMVRLVNRYLEDLPLSGPNMTPIRFQKDSRGHYRAVMSHAFQRHHEQDAIRCIANVLAHLGWSYRCELDAGAGKRTTGRESYIMQGSYVFHKRLQGHSIYDC